MNILTQINTFLVKNKTYMFALFFIGMGVDILYYAFFSDILFFPLVFFYLLLIGVYKLGSKDTTKIIIALLGVLAAFFVLDTETFHTLRVTSWIFFLLIIGIGQQVVDFSKRH